MPEIPIHLRPENIRKNADRIAAYLRQLADLMETEMGAVENLPKIATELKQRRSDAATYQQTIAGLNTKIAAYADVDAQADELVASAADPAHAAPTAKPLASDLYSRIPTPAQVAAAAAKVAAPK